VLIGLGKNRRLHRRESLYKITNRSINQTLSRTVITSGSGFFFCSVNGALWRGSAAGFSLALADRPLRSERIHRLLSRARSWFGGNSAWISRNRASANGGESVRTKGASCDERPKRTLWRAVPQAISRCGKSLEVDGCQNLLRRQCFSHSLTQFALDFAARCGIDCCRCWPINTQESDPVV